MLHYAPGKIGKHGFFLSWKILHGQMLQFTFRSELDAQYSKTPLLFNNKYLLSVPYCISLFLFCDIIITLRTIFFCTIFKGSPVHLFLFLGVTLLVLLFFFDHPLRQQTPDLSTHQIFFPAATSTILIQWESHTASAP